MMLSLEDDKYIILKCDLSLKTENSIAKILIHLRTDFHLDEKLCNLLTPRYMLLCPRMYGLPKVDNEGTP